MSNKKKESSLTFGLIPWSISSAEIAESITKGLIATGYILTDASNSKKRLSGQWPKSIMLLPETMEVLSTPVRSKNKLQKLCLKMMFVVRPGIGIRRSTLKDSASRRKYKKS